jgi:dolichyl-phosphate-mannose--protein O-mannosyl transferase
MLGRERTRFSTTDVFMLLVLTLAAFATRLWLQAEPAIIVFDEVHFAAFATYYLRGDYFFDIHPPLAKLILGLVAWLSDCDFNVTYAGHFDEPMPSEEYVILRLVPQFFSALCVPLIYIIVRVLDFSIPAALTSSGLILFETSLIAEGRYVLTDSILHFFVCLHLLVLFMALRRNCNIEWLIYCGASLGAACACKVTSWSLIAVDAAVLTIDSISISGKRFLWGWARRGFAVCGLTVFVFYLTFVLHFVLTPYWPSDLPYLPREYEDLAMRHDNEMWPFRLRPPRLFVRILAMLVDMHKSNLECDPWHEYESRPFSWPLLTSCYVGFHRDRDFHRQVHCMGNLYVYYIAFYAIVVVAFCAPFNRNWVLFILVFGFLVSYLPFFAIHRSTFLYHYQIPLIFACLVAGPCQDILFGRWGTFATIAAVTFAMKGLSIWYPIVYGYYMRDWKPMMWDRRWWAGDSVHLALQSQRKATVPED